MQKPYLMEPKTLDISLSLRSESNGLLGSVLHYPHEIETASTHSRHQ